MKKSKELKKKRVIFVDSDNLLWAQKKIKDRLNDFELFRFLARRKESEIFYYFTPTEITAKRENDEEHHPLGFIDFVFNGLRPQLERVGIPFKIFIATKSEDIDPMVISGIAAVLLSQKEIVEEIVLVSGDGIYNEILWRARNQGVRVKVVAGKEACSGKLKSVANKIIYLEDLVAEHPDLVLSPRG